jgi:uncharacterized membrane protein
MMGGVKLFDMVPIVLPLIYAPMVLIAYYVLRKFKPIYRVLGVGVLLMLVDVVMDPGLTVNGVWYWYDSWIGVNVHGVPVQNFIGWFLTGSLSAWILLKNVEEDFWSRGDLDEVDKFWIWVSPLSLSLVYWGGGAVRNGFWLSVLVGACVLEFFGRRLLELNKKV